MCDNKEVDRLTRLNFVGFQSEVEDTLAFKARNTDPLAEPDYAKVLYAWYVFRGDYRSGKFRLSARHWNNCRPYPSQLLELCIKEPSV